LQLALFTDTLAMTNSTVFSAPQGTAVDCPLPA
jgi:hypothetical protein